MKFILLLIFSFLLFLLTIIGFKKYKVTTLYALAIGGIVNANFFQAFKYPIECFRLPFGIDSIIYVLFIFCAFLMFYKSNKKDAYFLSLSSVLAIIISATFQFLADLFATGYSLDVLKVYLTFLSSALASSIMVIIVFECGNKIKDKINKYIFMLIFLLTAFIIYNAINIPLYILINGNIKNATNILLTTCFGGLIGIVSSYLPFYLINKYYSE